MDTCDWVRRVPIEALYVIPGIGGLLNAGIVLLPQVCRRVQFGNFENGAISAAFLGVTLVCLYAAIMKTRDEVRSRRRTARRVLMQRTS